MIYVKILLLKEIIILEGLLSKSKNDSEISLINKDIQQCKDVINLINNNGKISLDYTSMLELLLKLKYMRVELGYSLREVERKTGVSEAYISQIETGKIKKPSYERVMMLYNFYDKELQK